MSDMIEENGVANQELPDFEALALRFDQPGVTAVVLMGSHARGSARPYSDIDLVRFTASEKSVLPSRGSHLIDGRLVVVSDLTPRQLEAAFTEPQKAVESIQGLRSGRALLDRDNQFSAVQQRALAFNWNSELQAKADYWASSQMVGWTEEVHKGLEGLRSDDTGRLLHARFGCSWGMARVMCVQRGTLLRGDNSFYEQVTNAVGDDSEWTRLCRAAYGVGPNPSTLHEQVEAGLLLYKQTAALLDKTIIAEDRALIEDAVGLINHALSMSREPRRIRFPK